MPNRYQREIEEILSRMEESEPRRGLGDRIRPVQRPPIRARSLPTTNLSVVEALLLASILLTLIACGLAYFDGAADLISGVIGVVALVLFVVALVVGWRDRFRPQHKAAWRGPTSAQVTPIHRNPFSAIATQIRVYRLRQQYRRAQRDLDDK